MKEAVIVSAVRTAVGRAPRGRLRRTRPEKLGVTVLNELLRRTPGLMPTDIDDVVIGNSTPEAEQGLNLGRVLVMAAGLPDQVSGMTANRFCASGLQAIAQACERVMTGQADCLIAGGIESMSLVAMGGNMMYPFPDLVRSRPGAFSPMGLTAENVAEKFGGTRQEMDAFALKSHLKAAAATREGRFREEIVPVEIEEQVFDPSTKRFAIKAASFDADECIRPDTTLEALAKLPPVFRPNGVVTAGNSSPTSDGAALTAVMSREKAGDLGLKPLAVFRGFQVAGCEPEYMGIGPIYAIPKLLKRTGLKMDDIDLIELNEAFAVQAMVCIRELNLNPAIVNVNGGAIALGHPLGCTGAKLTVQLLHEMPRRQARFGVVSMCVGFGMGAAGLFEFVSE